MNAIHLNELIEQLTAIQRDIDMKWSRPGEPKPSPAVVLVTGKSNAIVHRPLHGARLSEAGTVLLNSAEYE